jgi:glycerate kinase
VDGRSRRVLAAPDKFKGTFAAGEVAAALARGARAAGWEAVERPIADGGEGTADALLAARGGRWVAADAHDALGRPLRTRFVLLADGRTAVVEVAAASGLWRLTPEELDPRAASTRGTGELIAAAAASGAESVIVAAGGSATTDGGRGAIEAMAELGRPPRIVVACDTTVVYEDAAAVYGPQKGASATEVAELGARLDALAAAAPRDPRGLPMGGAAGGLAGGLWAWCGAELAGGAALVLDALAVDAELAQVDVVLTGEGCIDGQTVTGKAVGELADRCARAGVPCAAIVGRDELSPEDRARLGVAGVVEATTLDGIAEAAATVLAGR